MRRLTPPSSTLRRSAPSGTAALGPSGEYSVVSTMSCRGRRARATSWWGQPRLRGTEGGRRLRSAGRTRTSYVVCRLSSSSCSAARASSSSPICRKKTPSCESGQLPRSRRFAAATMTDSGSSDGALVGSRNGLFCGRRRISFRKWLAESDGRRRATTTRCQTRSCAAKGGGGAAGLTRP